MIGRGITGGPVGLVLGAALAPLMHSEDLAVLDVVPGQTYFVEMGAGAWHPKMTVRPADKAERDVADCHWINPPGSPSPTGR